MRPQKGSPAMNIDRRVCDVVPVFDGEKLHGLQSIEGQ